MHCWQCKIIIIIIIPLQTKYCVRKKIWIKEKRNTCQMHKTQVWMTSLWLWGLICIPFWLRFENVSKNTQIKYIISKPNGFQKHPWQENNMEAVSGSLYLVQLVDRSVSSLDWRGSCLFLATRRRHLMAPAPRWTSSKSTICREKLSYSVCLTETLCLSRPHQYTTSTAHQPLLDAQPTAGRPWERALYTREGRRELLYSTKIQPALKHLCY